MLTAVPNQTMQRSAATAIDLSGRNVRAVAAAVELDAVVLVSDANLV